MGAWEGGGGGEREGGRGRERERQKEGRRNGISVKFLNNTRLRESRAQHGIVQY